MSRKDSLALRGDCKKRASLQLSRVGRLSTTTSRRLKSIKRSAFTSLNRLTTGGTRAACVSSAVGRAHPPAVKGQAAEHWLSYVLSHE